MAIKTNKLLSDLDKISPKLASIVDQIISGINSENYNIQDSSNIEDYLKDSIDRLASNQTINLIPSDQKGACHEICVCEAFGRWHARTGFSGIIKETINYWLGCFQINKSTIIFTNAWDQHDFEYKYEQAFENYSLGGPHQTAVILVTPQDLSLVYCI